MLALAFRAVREFSAAIRRLLHHHWSSNIGLIDHRTIGSDQPEHACATIDPLPGDREPCYAQVAAMHQIKRLTQYRND